VTEYLVDLDFVREEFERDVGLELVDTDLFINQMMINKRFIMDAARYESTPDTRGYFLTKVATFFNANDETTVKSMQYSDLYRYYVFRKKKSPAPHKGGDYEEKYDFSDITRFQIPMMSTYQDEYSLAGSVHKMLVSHMIIPRAVTLNQFMADVNVGLLEDNQITDKYLKKLADRLVIRHQTDSRTKDMLDGLNIFFVERDCNNFYDITYVTKTNQDANDRALVLMKENDLYRPLMRRDPKGTKGIYRMHDPMIKHLVENGSHV
jgi:hypothetical protein